MRGRKLTATAMWLAGAALLLGAVPSAASAAAPEYGRCVKVAPEGKTYHGGYSEAKCAKASATKTGKYEWLPGAEKHKFTTSGGVAVLTTVGNAQVECQKESSGGEFVPGNNKEEKGIVVKFNGCKALGNECTTPGAAAGELITNELEGIIGWEVKASKKTDLELSPAKSVASGLFIEFSCTGLVVKVRGHLLVPIKNDKMTATETLKYSEKRGVQKPDKWEEAPGLTILEASFKGGPFEEAGQEITATVTGEEELELNAVV
jgi:hypothetical protein